MFFANVCSALEQFDVLRLLKTSYTGILTNVVVFVVVALSWAMIIFVSVGGDLLLADFKNLLASMFVNFSKNLFKENLLIKTNIFFYFLFSLFTFLLFGNAVGLVPYTVTITSFIVITFFFSCTGFIASVLIGLYVHRSHFFSLFIPSGTPAALKSSLVFIELVSYCARLFSLAIRIFANMMAGHALLKILSGFAWVFLSNMSLLGVAALVVLCVVWAVTVLELLMAFLQSYVFIVLTSIYLNEAVNLH